MKRSHPPDKIPENGVSEILAQFLIIFLVMILIAFVIADVTGILPTMLQKSALLSVQASSYNTTSNVHVISLLHQQGNPVNINGSSQTEGISPLSFTLTHSNTDVIVRNSPAIEKNAWKSGDRLFIYYQTGGYYYVTDNLTWLNSQGASVEVPSGSWSVNVIDAKIGLLLQKLPIEIR
ncbi:MAG: type IV pilin [Methanoregula sp.]|nr:type IV pilin [Methanoregula sp.]